MNSSDIKWLKQVKKYPRRFKIVIDNDQVWVEDYVEEEIVYEFNSFGDELLYEVLNHFGCKAEWC